MKNTLTAERRRKTILSVVLAVICIIYVLPVVAVVINSFKLNTYVKTDMGLKDMLYFATQGMKLNTSSGVSSATLEGRGDAYYRASAWCMELNQESTVKLVNELVNPYTRDLTLKDMNLPRAERYYFNY